MSCSSSSENEPTGVEVIPTMCAAHCGGSCLLKCHVKDGVLIKVETDDGPEPQYRGCLKGRASRQYVYSPERILYPMKRIGERGEGKWERISWDEALDTIVSRIKKIKEENGRILMIPGLGDVQYLHRMPATMSRLQYMIGLGTGPGASEMKWPFQYSWNITSYAQGVAGSQFTYGTIHTASNREDMANSRMIILWGWDPAGMVHGQNTCWNIARAREAGARIVAVDPKHSDTAATFAERWIPIYPGTDAAALIAMAYVMIDEDIYDKKFIEKYTVGFDKYKDYVMGIEDGMPKTPRWASEITGIPAEDIVQLAREYATIKPAAFMAGIAPGRTAYGEQYHRAAIVLACMTGNVGISGGDAAGRAWESTWPGVLYPGAHPIDDGMRKGLLGPLPEEYQKVKDEMYRQAVPPTPQSPPVHANQMADIFGMGIFDMMFTSGASMFAMGMHASRWRGGYDKIKFNVIMEQFMTIMCKEIGDLLLPCTTFFERNDITYGVGAPFIGKINKVIEPVGEARNFIDVADELARRLGAEGYLDPNKTEDDYIREFAEKLEIPDYEEFKRTGVYRYPWEPEVCFREQIEDPENNPFPTPSGKIEIYSEEIASWGLDTFPPIPKYIETWESQNDPLAGKYPLQLTTPHFKRRQLTKLDHIPWLREVQKQVVRINARDAEERGIVDGEEVMVFNDRGKVFIPARVTERIMQGVVEIPFGAWFHPAKGGATMQENANVLTNTPYSPSGGMAYNTSLVQVEKIGTTKSEDVPNESSVALTIDSTIGDLLADAECKAILDKYIPDLSASPHMEMIKGMTLKGLAPMSQGMVTPEKLKDIEEDLKKI